MNCSWRLLLLGICLSADPRFATAQSEPANPAGRQTDQPPVSDQRSVADQPRVTSNNSIAGCFAAACHGSRDTSLPISTRSAVIWHNSDPHASAYRVLFNSSSVEIVHRLSKGKILRPDAPEFRQFLEDSCVACHATQDSPLDTRELGVNCQSCHGPADAWDQRHWSSEWASLGASRFNGTAMRDTESLRSRVQLCVECHVGKLAEGRDSREVNHDLIAAGHPPLFFEFESYWQRAVAHWDPSKDVTRFGNQASYWRWKSGAQSAAISRLLMLANRTLQASSGNATRPWPELAEYSCFDCHHTLSSASWRAQAIAGRNKLVQAKPDGGNDLVRSRWDPWTRAAVEFLAIGRPDDNLRGLVDQLAAHAESPSGDSAEIAKLAQNLADKLASTSAGEPSSGPSMTTQQLREQVQLLLADDSIQASWERTKQWQLAAIALSNSLGLKTLTAELTRLDDGLLRRSRGLTSGFFDSEESLQPISPALFQPPLIDSRRRMLEIFHKEGAP